MKVERNRPCPCGSGLKAKRCCLDRLATLGREVLVAEKAAMGAADDARTDEPARFVVGFSEVFVGAGDPLAQAFAPGHELLEAALHLICDSDDDGSPRAEAEHRAREILDSAELRAWRVGAQRGAGLMEATCMATGERTELESVRPPTGVLAEGRVVLARCLPRPGGRFAMLGAPPVVDPAAQADFEEIVCDLSARCPGTADLGGETASELLAAAWCWPEERDHTADGQIVVGQYVDYELGHPEAVLTRLLSDPMFEPVRDDDDQWSTFAFRPHMWEGFERRQPPPERGVRWRLCAEEAVPVPGLAEVSLDRWDEELTLHTLTSDRMARAERELHDVLGDLLGEEISRFSDNPDVMRRWQRERFDRREARWARTAGAQSTARRSLTQAV